MKLIGQGFHVLYGAETENSPNVYIADNEARPLGYHYAQCTCLTGQGEGIFLIEITWISGYEIN